MSWLDNVICSIPTNINGRWDLAERGISLHIQNGRKATCSPSEKAGTSGICRDGMVVLALQCEGMRERNPRRSKSGVISDVLLNK